MSQVTTPIFKGVARVFTTYPVSTLALKLVTESPGNSFPNTTSKTGIRSIGVITKYPAAPIDYTATINVNWYDVDIDGLAAVSYGEFYNGVVSSSTSKLGVGTTGSFIVGISLIPSGINQLVIGSLGDIWVDIVKKNWVKWSNIGSADFTIWKDNIAGARPLDWTGWVYSIKKLGNKVIVYGENGVSSLFPSGVTYGMQTIYRIGIKGRGAVNGDNSIHFFVDTSGHLFSMGELARKSSLFEETMRPEDLGYSEYLSSMGDLTLSWDSLNKLLYICDGITGYIYNPSSKSFGKGPNNITGIETQGGIQYVGSPIVITTPTFEISTDIFDLSSRKNKNIKYVEVGTNLSGLLEGSIDYRLSKSASFQSTPWVLVNPNGIFHLPCFGIEFKFKLRAPVLEDFKIDYIKVYGKVLNFAYLDVLNKQ